MSRRPPHSSADPHIQESDEDFSDEPQIHPRTTHQHHPHHDEDDDDDEFDFDGSGSHPPHHPPQSTKVSNHHYDEAVDLADDDSTDDAHQMPSNTHFHTQQPAQSAHAGGQHSDSESDESSSDALDSSLTHKSTVKRYNPMEFAHLAVSSEIRDLFDYIGRFKPLEIELETRLAPFIPDFIPAIGEMDTFIKIPHPDEKVRDDLGLTVLDEPNTQQSDPTVVELQLRVIGKQASMQPATVGFVEHAEKNPKKITKWIQSIESVHKQKAPQSVQYTGAMPDIDSLMQAWPNQFENALSQLQLPDADLDLSTEEFARVACALLDIPVYDKVTESLHVLFTLFAEFKNNPHFQST